MLIEHNFLRLLNGLIFPFSNLNSSIINIAASADVSARAIHVPFSPAPAMTVKNQSQFNHVDIKLT
jgi:hypothetical protein